MIPAWRGCPLDAIPICFALAANAALFLVLFARLRGRAIDATARLPFDAPSPAS